VYNFFNAVLIPHYTQLWDVLKLNVASAIILLQSSWCLYQKNSAVPVEALDILIIKPVKTGYKEGKGEKESITLW